MAMASSRLKPSMNALRKSQVRWMAERSSVSSHSLMSTVFFLLFMRICNFMFLTTVSHIFSQLFLRGVIRLGGISTDCISKLSFLPFSTCFSGASINCSACIVEILYPPLQTQQKHSYSTIFHYPALAINAINTLILYILSFAAEMNRKKKSQPSPPVPKRIARPAKGTIEDIYPFQLPALERMSPQLKQYINELEREYIERYNILLNNRNVYSQIIESVSTELDGVGIERKDLDTICETVKVREGER